MMRTKRQLMTATMRKKGWLDQQAEPDNASLKVIAEIYDAKLEEWRVDRKCVYWTNTDLNTEEIPLAVFEPLVMLLANQAAPAFGELDTLENIMAREELLLFPLRRHVARQKTGVPVRGEYF